MCFLKFAYFVCVYLQLLTPPIKFVMMSERSKGPQLLPWVNTINLIGLRVFYSCEPWESCAAEMFGYLFPSYLYPPCALLFIAPPLQRWRHLWNLQGNVDRLRSHTEGVLQIKHPNYSHQLALFALQMHPLSAIMNMAPIRDPYDGELFFTKY